MADKNAIQAYDIMLQKHIDKRDFVKICRTFKEREENISGFILAMSRNFLLLQLDHDYSFNGYAIIRKDQFDSLDCYKFEKTYKEICRKEGFLKGQFGLSEHVSLKSWPDIFNDLRKWDYHVVVECEDKEEPDFIIGPIKRVSKDRIGIQYYDATGQLDAGMTSIKYDDITIVKFGDRYSTTFRKYLKSPKLKK